MEEELLVVRADFNGLFSGILCLSHEEYCVAEAGRPVAVTEGLRIAAFDEDVDENGQRDDLIATGVMERAPVWLRCNGSKWVLRIDEKGVRNRSDL
jgi:hypothetical protein